MLLPASRFHAGEDNPETALASSGRAFCVQRGLSVSARSSLALSTTWLGIKPKKETKMSYQAQLPIAIVSDCGGQAMSRMISRYYALLDAVCIPYDSLSLVEASGNIVDALDAFRGFKSAVVCNSAPRRDTRGTNGSAIVYGTVGKTIIISTVCALGLLKKLVPNFTARKVSVKSFMQSECGNKSDTTPNFRGLEVIPSVLSSLVYEHNVSGLSLPYSKDNFPLIEPSVWLVDTIEGKPTNIKLTILRDEASWFKPGDKITIKFGGEPFTPLTCYERLTHIPDGEAGIYVGSSGLGDRRFLEVAVMGGRAAEMFNVFKSGTPVVINPT